ncbi:MAG: methyltransferase [Planctomycetota bacterium]|jgi:methyltransferase
MRSLFWIPLIYCLLMRVFELVVSRRNERTATLEGGRRVRPDATAGLVIVHTLWFAGLILEELLLGPRAWPSWVLPVAGSIAVAAEALRLACMLTLGKFWNVAVVIRPDAQLVRRGPYRYLEHPNYLAVVVLLVSMPLALGLPMVALFVLPMKLWALRARLRIEDAALGQVSGSAANS